MSEPARGEVLDLFAAAYRRSPDALAEYIGRYPCYAGDLVDYAHEISLQLECAAEGSITPEDEAWIEAEASRMSSMRAARLNPFAGLAPARYVEARASLGVPSVVLEAFRDRMVEVAGVPSSFLLGLANQLKVDVAELVQFLLGPPRLAPNLAFKADTVPRAPADKMSFSSVLAHAGVPADRMAALLAEDD